MEGGGRPLTAKEKRHEQLKRWENSITDTTSPVLHNVNPKVKFNDGAVFLAACSSGDLDEVQTLLNTGADVNFANVDGLTALHQACIDGNMEVVQFLVENGVEVDQEDNEGWTPLHAAASCGFIDIARYLVRQHANVAAVNSEGEVPLDIAEDDDMMEFLQNEINTQGVDIESARNEEQEIMVADAKQLLDDASNGQKPHIYRHPKSGATALHVAAAKGYLHVIKILMQAGVEVNLCDNDGWTPLHAASHWSQQAAAKVLAEKNADFNARSSLGQTPFDVADEDMLEYLEELKLQQEKLISSNLKQIDAVSSSISPSKLRTQVQEDVNLILNLEDATKKESVPTTPSTTERVAYTPLPHSHDDDASFSSDNDGDEADSTSSNELNSSHSDMNPVFEMPLNLKNSSYDNTSSEDLHRTVPSNVVNGLGQNNLIKRSVSGESIGTIAAVVGQRSTRLASSTYSSETRPSVLTTGEQASSRPVATAQAFQTSSGNISSATPPTPTERNSDIKEGAPGTWRSGLRKTGSFDEKMKPMLGGSRLAGVGSSSRAIDSDKTVYSSSRSSEENISKLGGIRTARVAPILDARLTIKNEQHSRGTGTSLTSDSSRNVEDSRSAKENETTSSAKVPHGQSATFAVGDSRPDKRRSHLQPVRDEEAEAQRKARSRRERQSRRSTQGVTLDVYEEAKRAINIMKTDRGEHSTTSPSKQNDVSDGDMIVGSVGIPHIDSNHLLHHRRHGYPSTNTVPTSTSRPVKLPAGYILPSERVHTTAKTAPVNPPNPIIPSINVNDNINGDDDESNVIDDRNTSAYPGQMPSTNKSAVQKRRRQRQERRSTGLIGLDSPNATIHDGCEDDNRKTDNDLPHYQKLYDEACLENEILRSDLESATKRIVELESRVDRTGDVAARHKSIDVEKRERKLLERKLVDVEKELLVLAELRADNQRLKDENGALIRVISKLSK